MDKTIPFYIEVVSADSSQHRICFWQMYGGESSTSFDELLFSYDNITWTNVTDIPTYGAIYEWTNLSVGDRIYIKAVPTNNHYYENYKHLYLATGQFGVREMKIGGNIMSLFYGSNFTGNETTFPQESNSRGLFCRDNIKDASQLLLPATTLSGSIYQYMFEDNSGLVKAPVITQATIRGGYPYDYMFQGCSSLENITIENTNIRVSDYILYRMSPKTIVYKKEGVTTLANPNNLTVVTLKNTQFNVANTKKWVINNKEVRQVVDSQGRVIWGKSSPTVLPYFYVEDMSGSENTLSINKISDYAPTLTIEMSRDGINWSTMGSTSKTAITASIPAYGRVYLRCNTSSWCANLGEANCIYCSQSYRVGGNIMSLLYGSNFTGNEVIFPSGSDSNFSYLFFNSSNISDASTLILPATTMTELCYAGMFHSCRALTTAPTLPATTLANYCYYSMFYGCTSLATAPALPATTLANFCYQCMFYGCTVMNNITCLATDISASVPLADWVNSVSQTGTFTKKAGVTWPTGVSGIPEGWTVVEE